MTNVTEKELREFKLELRKEILQMFRDERLNLKLAEKTAELIIDAKKQEIGPYVARAIRENVNGKINDIHAKLDELQQGMQPFIKISEFVSRHKLKVSSILMVAFLGLPLWFYYFAKLGEYIWAEFGKFLR